MYKRSLKWDRKGGRGDSGQLYQSRMRGEELGGGNDPVKVCQESGERKEGEGWDCTASPNPTFKGILGTFLRIKHTIQSGKKSRCQNVT